MALNPEFVGRTYPPSPPYVVGREKVREFANAVGDRNPAFHDVAAAQALGYSDVIAPPTFPFVLASQAMATAMFDPDLGLDYSRVVHGEQRFTYTRPVVAGDTLVTVATIDGIRSAAGNDLITVRADISTVHGDHVVTTYSTIVSRGTAEGS
jgi:acyl dehydratase